MKIKYVQTYNQMSTLAAKAIAEQIKQKPTSVLGLATGSTPVGTYDALVKMHKAGKADFSRVTTFNLDEYCGLEPKHPQSYRYFMAEKLFDHININKKKINFPDTNFDLYEAAITKAKGIDLQILGIGQNGHIGFNEPDTIFHNRTRKAALTPSTIQANARFFERATDVPTHALTMGIGTIMAARKIILLAGSDKADIVAKILESPVVDPQLPASILHYHPDCTIITVAQPIQATIS